MCELHREILLGHAEVLPICQGSVIGVMPTHPWEWNDPQVSPSGSMVQPRSQGPFLRLSKVRGSMRVAGIERCITALCFLALFQFENS